jgi:selenocysteine lyase/cysteine desulfurase
MNLGSSLQFPSGSEIILTKMEHETNVKPWLFMAERLNLTVKWWHSSEEDGLKLTAENLRPLLSNKVKFVACTHVSNILGTIHDVRSIAEAVHEVGALFCVDGVSCAASSGGCEGFRCRLLQLQLVQGPYPIHFFPFPKVHRSLER